MDFFFDLNLKKRTKILLSIISVITFITGPILLGFHYEDESVDIPIGILVIAYIFTIFWGLIVGLLTLCCILIISFLLLNCCCNSIQGRSPRQAYENNMDEDVV